MQKNIKLFNFIGGIALSVCALRYFFLCDFYFYFDMLDISTLLNLIAGSMLIVDFVKNKENQTNKLSLIAILVALLGSYYYFYFIFSSFGYYYFLVIFLFIAIGLYVLNRKAIVEFIKSQIHKKPVKKTKIKSILHCIGGAGVLAYIIYPIIIKSDDWFDIEEFSMESILMLSFVILILAVVSLIISKTIRNKTGIIIQMSALYSLVVIELLFVLGGGIEFLNPNNGVGWFILKLVCAIVVLFCQSMLIKNCFIHFNKKFGEFIASLIVGTAAAATVVLAAIVLIILVVIAIVVVVGYFILKLTTAGGMFNTGEGEKSKKVSSNQWCRNCRYYSNSGNYGYCNLSYKGVNPSDSCDTHFHN
ncbi:MAG: hypothetical protein LBN23_04255 [Paludibacter sp.]|jgi:hypothetical protein|nr:hypothetical protein [Paludibacter sp.]